MIIQLRGTSGSGKSTLVRQVISHYASKTALYKDGRKRPVCYHLEREDGAPLFVLGHYETPCGGCDTLPSYDAAFALVHQYRGAGDVLFEGLLLSGETRRALALVEQEPAYVNVVLNVPADLCLESINQRRRAKNPEAPDVNPRNTLAKLRAIDSAARKLRAASGHVRHAMTREEALEVVLEELGV